MESGGSAALSGDAHMPSSGGPSGVRRHAQNYIAEMADMQDRLLSMQEEAERRHRSPGTPRSGSSADSPRHESPLMERTRALQMSARGRGQRAREGSEEYQAHLDKLADLRATIEAASGGSGRGGLEGLQRGATRSGGWEGLTMTEMRALVKRRDDEAAAKDTLIAELTRELARSRRAAKGKDGIEEMAFEIEALLTRQVELEEELLRSERKLQDAIRLRARTSSPMEDESSSAARRRARALEAQVDASMSAEQRLRAENAILLNERVQLQRHLSARDAQIQKRLRLQDNVVRKAQGLKGRMERLAHDKEAWESSYNSLSQSTSLRIKELSDAARELSEENSRQKKIIAALQVAMTNHERDRAMHPGEARGHGGSSPPSAFDKGGAYVEQGNGMFNAANSYSIGGPAYSDHAPALADALHYQNGDELYQEKPAHIPSHVPSTALPPMAPGPASPPQPAGYPTRSQMRPISPYSPYSPAHRAPSPSLSPMFPHSAAAPPSSHHDPHRDSDVVFPGSEGAEHPYQPPPRPVPYELRAGRRGPGNQPPREPEPYAPRGRGERAGESEGVRVLSEDEMDRLRYDNDSCMEEERERHLSFKRRVQGLIGTREIFG